MKFKLIDMVRAAATETWGKVKSHEFEEAERLAKMYGEPAGNFYRIPGEALRDLNVSTASAGGYLADVKNLDYLPALQPTSVALALGAQVVPASPGGAALPRGVTGASTTWLATETQQAAESTPVFGQVAGLPKLLMAFCEVSRPLLLQSNAERELNVELSRAGGAALDAAILAGTGSNGQPLGIVGTPGIGAFTGASVAQAHLRNAQADVAAANGLVTGRVGYVTTPAVAEILAGRPRVASSDRMLLEGASHDGIVEGVRTLATTGCPASTIVFGDWGSVYVIEWAGGLQISVDPYTKFAQGIVGVRLLFPVDVFVTRPQSFSVATSVS